MERFGFHANLNGYYDASLNLHRVTADRSTRLIDDRDTVRALIDSPGALAREQETIRHAVLEGVGGLPVASAVDGYQCTGTLREDAFSIERIVYESEPGISVTANLYRPSGEADKVGLRPAIFFACGHSDAAKAETRYQIVARMLAASGFVVLSADPIGQGERHSYVRPDDVSADTAWGTAEHTYAGIQCWWGGRSIARYMLRDAMAGISLLASLAEVDAERIGVTGNSGGGLLTTLLMALDPRVAAAAPGTFVSGRGAYQHSGQRQDAEQILLGGTAAGVDHADLLLTMSPRPVLVLAAEYDFFPFEATLETLERTNNVLAASRQQPVQLFSAPVPHRYDEAMAAEAVRFFTEALGSDGASRGGDPSVHELHSVADLQVTGRGQIILERPDSETVFDSERRQAEHDRPDNESTFLHWLERRVRGDRKVSEAPFPRWFDSETHGELSTRAGYWFTEDQIITAGVFIRPATDTPIRELHVVVDDEGTPALSPASPWADLVEDDSAVFVVDLRASGSLAPHDRDGRQPTDVTSSIYKLSCDLLWLGDSLQAGRAFDLLRTIELVRGDLIPDCLPERIVLHGRGNVGFSVIIAALLDPEIAEVHPDGVVDPFHEISTRINNTNSGAWQCVLPGFTRHADEELVLCILGARLIQATGSNSASVSRGT